MRENPHISDMGSVQDWASVYPLFHWGPIPWSFYIILAVAFGFMLHVRKRNRQKYSEACRPVLGKRVDGALGRIIDLTAVFALLAGTATTFFSGNAPFIHGFKPCNGIPETPAFTIAILIAICIVYTMAVYFGMKGVARLASSCVGLFRPLSLFFLWRRGNALYRRNRSYLFGKPEPEFHSSGNLDRRPAHLLLSTELDYFYWAYWMVWCVATPFLSAASARDVPYGRPFWVDISSDCPAPLLLYHSWKLRAVPSDAWKAGSDGNLCSIPEPL